MKFNVSRRTDVALQALQSAATAGGPISGAQLTDVTSTSQAYLSQCLAPLISAGWLSSRTGPDGGYAATESTDRVTLLQLIEVMEGPLINGICGLDGRICEVAQKCMLHPIWAKAHLVFRDELAKLKVVDA